MNLIDNFLAAYTGNTRKAYARDVADWQAWLVDGEIELLAATRADVDRFARHLEAKGRSVSTVARKVAAVSGLYRYAVAENLLERNPAALVRRPHVSQDSQTVGLDRAEAIALLMAAKAESVRAHALVSLLLHTGCRVGEALAVTTDDIYIDGGHRVVRLHGKGGKIRVLPLAGAAGPIDELLNGREGVVFAGRISGSIAQSCAYDMIQRLAKAAGIPCAERITPHSLRHTSITAALNAGAATRDVQDFAGHADPRTTNRYDRARFNLDRSPAHALTDWFEVA